MSILKELEQNLSKKREEFKLVNARFSELDKAVSSARATLSANDYKRHKNVEYEAMGLTLPYSWEDIHNESQKLRDIINNNEPECDVLKETRSKILVEIRDLQIELGKKRAEQSATSEVPESKPAESTKKEMVWAFETTGN